MSNTNSLKALIKNIADAIRNRTSKSASMTIEEMPNEIASIQGPYPTQSKTVDVKKNGELIVEPDEGYVLDKVTANVDVVAVSDNNAKIVVDSAMTSMSSVAVKALRSIDVSGWDTSNVTSMYGMFLDCASLTQLDVSSLDASKVTDFESFAGQCKSLEKIDVTNLVKSSCQTLGGMIHGSASFFYNDVSLKEIVGLDTWDTSNVKGMSLLFYSCESLTSLDLSSWDTSNVTDMGNMFYRCHKLETVDLSSWDTSNVTSMYGMFSSCFALKQLEIAHFNTSKVKSIANMFGDCRSLTSLDLSSWDTSNVTSMGSYDFYGVFQYCGELTDVTFGNNWGSNESLAIIHLGSRNALNKTSILDLFNKLATRTNSPTLALDNETVKSQLTEEEIAIATNKGWVVS